MNERVLHEHVLTCVCVFGPARFDIVLMREGRMKGQAFIGLPNERSAEKALKETNGYVLHDKPLVVVSFFGRFWHSVAGCMDDSESNLFVLIYLFFIIFYYFIIFSVYYFLSV